MARTINFNGSLIYEYGAYIRTDLSALTEINGVSSGIIAFVGLAERGPVNKAVTITSYIQLVETFGDGPLVRHALAAYVGGANEIVCVRVGDPDHATLSVITAANDVIVSPGGDGSEPASVYFYKAKEAGSLGNNINISVVAAGEEAKDNETQRIHIRYIDERGNDFREVYQFPRYIPNMEGTLFASNRPVSDGGEIHDDEVAHFYVLRNRETGTISDIPTTWGYGNPTREDFLDKVNDLKATSEDLIGPFPTHVASERSLYPLAIVQTALNTGAMGYAPSQFVTLKGVDPAAEELLITDYDAATAEALQNHGPVNLAGGHNGDDGTNYYGTPVTNPITNEIEYDYNMTFESVDDVMDSWVYGLGVLEDEEVNFVQPAYLFNYAGDGNEFARRYSFFKSLTPQILAHITNMSGTQPRKFRSSILGIPFFRDGVNINATEDDFLEAIQDVSGMVNHDRVQLWAGGFYSRAFSNSLEAYGADMLASFVVGAQAAKVVSESLTFDALAGIFTDGLEFAWRQHQKNELYARSLAFAKKRRTTAGATEYVAAHNETSFVGAPSRGVTSMHTRRIIDYTNTFMFKNFEENFTGAKSRGAETAARMNDFANNLLNMLIRDDILVAVANVEVTVDDNDKTVYYINFDTQPVSEVKFMPMTNRIVYNLA